MKWTKVIKAEENNELMETTNKLFEQYRDISNSIEGGLFNTLTCDKMIELAKQQNKEQYIEYYTKLKDIISSLETFFNTYYK